MQIKNTYLHQSVLYLSKFIKQHQQAYYEGLTKIHAQGDYEACIKQPAEDYSKNFAKKKY